MALASWVEFGAAFCACTSTAHVFVDAKHMLAVTAKNSFLASFFSRPGLWYVCFQGVVAADTCIKLLAAGVLDGDNVTGRRVVLTLGERCYIEAVDGGCAVMTWGESHDVNTVDDGEVTVKTSRAVAPAPLGIGRWQGY